MRNFCPFPNFFQRFFFPFRLSVVIVCSSFCHKICVVVYFILFSPQSSPAHYSFTLSNPYAKNTRFHEVFKCSAERLLLRFKRSGVRTADGSSYIYYSYCFGFGLNILNAGIMTVVTTCQILYYYHGFQPKIVSTRVTIRISLNEVQEI